MRQGKGKTRIRTDIRTDAGTDVWTHERVNMDMTVKHGYEGKTWITLVIITLVIIITF